MAKVADGPDSLRIDIPKDDVAPNNRRVERVNYTVVFRSEWTDMSPIYAIVNEALAEAEKKRAASKVASPQRFTQNRPMVIRKFECDKVQIQARPQTSQTDPQTP